MIVIESKHRKRKNILKKYPDAVIADVTGHPCGIGENMGDFVPLSGYHFTLSEGMESKCGHCRNGYLSKLSLLRSALLLTISKKLRSSNKLKSKRTFTLYSVCLPNLCPSGLPVWV